MRTRVGAALEAEWITGRKRRSGGRTRTAGGSGVPIMRWNLFVFRSLSGRMKQGIHHMHTIRLVLHDGERGERRAAGDRWPSAHKAATHKPLPRGHGIDRTMCHKTVGGGRQLLLSPEGAAADFACSTVLVGAWPSQSPLAFVAHGRIMGCCHFHPSLIRHGACTD